MKTKINENIRASNVRLIAQDGSQLGIVSLKEALDQSEEHDLDLVEISSGDPIVCKIMDYSKFKYDQEKKKKKSTKKTAQNVNKEIKVRPNIAENDLNIKTKKIEQFIQKGYTVKFTVMYRGREMTHQEKGREIAENVAKNFEEVATITSPKMEGRNLMLSITPKGR